MFEYCNVAYVKEFRHFHEVINGPYEIFIYLLTNVWLLMLIPFVT